MKYSCTRCEFKTDKEDVMRYHQQKHFPDCLIQDSVNWTKEE